MVRDSSAACEDAALLLEDGRRSGEPLEAHLRPWRWRGARICLASAVVWCLFCETLRPRSQAYWGDARMKGVPAWRLMLMMPTTLAVLPTILALAWRHDARGLTLEEWGERWAAGWRASFTGVAPQHDFSWAFLGAAPHTHT
jgi:hypothetical protein